MNYAEYLWNRNRKYRITVCFDDGHQAIGYGDLPQNIRGTAGWLQAQGVKPYDRVLLQMEDCTELPVLIMGCHWLGAVPVLAHPDQKLPADLPPIKLTITDPDQFELVDDVKIPFMKPTNECAENLFLQAHRVDPESYHGLCLLCVLLPINYINMV